MFKNRYLRVALYTLLSIILIVAVSWTSLSFLYEKTINRYLGKYLNEHLQTQLSMNEIRFRLFKGFPNVTVEISDFTILSGSGFSSGQFSGSFADTLLQANSVFFQFDIRKLLHKEFVIKKLEVQQGHLNVLVDRNNHNNLNIWKSGAPDTGRSMNLNLQGVLLNDLTIKYFGLPEQLELTAFTDKAALRGSLNGSIFSGNVRGKILIQRLQSKHMNILREASLQIDADLLYAGERVKISDGKLTLNNIITTIKGELNTGKDKIFSLTMHSSKFGLDELISILPLKNSLIDSKYRFTGNGKFSAMIDGSLKGKGNLKLISDFALIDGKARNSLTKAEISKINLTGTAKGSTVENFEINITRFSSEMDKGSAQGTMSLNNLRNPLFRAEIQSVINLEPLKDFIGIDTLESAKGIVRADFIAHGALNQFSDTTFGLLDCLDQGTFIIDNAELKLKGNPMVLKDIRGKARWDKTLHMDSISLVFNNTNLLLSGSVNNLDMYLKSKEHLKAEISISADELDIGNLLAGISGADHYGKHSGTILFPKDIYVKARVSIARFIAGKFKADQVSLNLDANNDSVYIRDCRLQFPDGSISGNAMITANSNRIISITCNSFPVKINIQELFTSFNNFTQQFIVDKNVRGRLSGSIRFFAQWDSAWKFIPASLVSQSEIEITNGELVQFEPMLELSKYIDVEELRHIRFKTLKNSIYIKDRLVTIPEMEIKSSAFNISVSGEHSFDNKFDYRMKVLLSEVLFNKARKKKKEMDEFLIEDSKDDQTTIPLIIAGTPDNFDVRFDRRKAFDLSRKAPKEETVSGKQEPVSNKNFEIEWDDSEIRQEKVEKPVSSGNKGDFTIEWEEEDDPDIK